MYELMQRFGLWFARWAGWSEQAIVAPLQEIITRQTHALADLHQELAALNARMATAATVSPSVLERATQLTSDADTTLVGGEAKRHAVYAKLIKDFPTVSKRELALSIELALFGKEPQSP